MATLQQLFLHVCGQVNCWMPGGKALPFCQRCTGLYVGGAFALLLYVLFRPRPTSLMLWIHGLLLLLIVPFGYHFVPQNGTIRTLTGQLFAYGLMHYLALNPSGQLGVGSGSHPENVRGYVWGALAAIPVLQLAVHLGGAVTGVILAGLGLVGLLVYTVLAIANLVVLPVEIGRLLRRGRRSPTR